MPRGDNGDEGESGEMEAATTVKMAVTGLVTTEAVTTASKPTALLPYTGPPIVTTSRWQSF